MKKLLVLLAAIPMAAQPALELSLKKAVEIALSPDGSTRAKLAEEAVKQASARSAESRAALLPDLSGGFKFENQTVDLQAFGITFPKVPGFNFPTLAGPFDTLDARASLTQSIFDFSSIRRYQAGRVGIRASEAERETTRDDVAGATARAYLSAVRADAALETARSNVDLSAALVKLAQSEKSAGTGTGIEVTRANVQLANDRQRLLVAQNDRTSASLRLLKTMGLRLDTPLVVVDKLTYVATEPVDPAKAVASAREARAALKAQRERVENARLSYSAAALERLPTVAGFANYGTIGTTVNNSTTTRAFGVSLNIPLFDGGRRQAYRAESASQYRQEIIRSADLADQVDLEVRLALEALQSADAQVKTAQEGLQLADNELEQAQRRYQAGVTSSIEVTDAQTRLIRARDNQINALYNHNLARIDLGEAMGTIRSMLQ